MLEQFQDIVTSLVFDCAHKHRSQEVIINLDSFGLSSQYNESFSIFFESLTPFKEQYELLEDLGGYIVIILEQVLHGDAQQNWVLLVNSNEGEELDQLRVDVIFVFKL